MKEFDLHTDPHRRFNPLTGEWILVSPHRADRPWQGQTEPVASKLLPAYDPSCYLCPGNVRANGIANPTYSDCYVFDNDFAALKADAVAATKEDGPFFTAKPERGISRVVCFSPDHSLTLPEMNVPDIIKIVEMWQQQYTELGSIDYINHVQIFENKGAIMGCSNPHPHGQIWAQSSLPTHVERTQKNLSAYFNEHHRSLLADYLAQELEKTDRIVIENDDFVALVPFWATWPFETMIISRRHLRRISDFTDAEKASFASILKSLTIRYDNLFLTSFPYSAGIHQSPTDGIDHPEWHFHMHFYPPLLRSATVKKFMVGYEMLGESQRDITPEKSAALLRDLSEIHYKAR